MSETGMISGLRISDWTGRCLMVTALVAMIGCAEDSGRRDSAGTEPGSTSGSQSTSASTTEKTSADQKTARDQSSATQTAQTEDIRFVATEEQNTKMWKASGPTSTAGGGNTVSLNIKNRGSKPLTFKAVNMLSAEHGFAIDSMKVQTILKPGEERTITVPLENIDPSVSEHRVYCQLHPKHMAAAVVVMNDQNADAARATRQDSAFPEGGSIGSQTGEASSRISGESEGQRIIREQSQRQREIESTSRSEQAPGSTALKGCEGFPGFDRGCPGGSNRSNQP